MDALSLPGGDGYECDVLGEVLDPVVALYVEPLLGELANELPVLLLEESYGVLRLVPHRECHRPPSLSVPAMDPVYLVGIMTNGVLAFFRTLSDSRVCGLAPSITSTISIAMSAREPPLDLSVENEW